MITRSQPPQPIRPNLRADFLLDPKLTFLNHGSFGSVPRVVLDEQTYWHSQIESDPIEILGRQSTALIDSAKLPIGDHLGIKPKDFGLVTNATEGINCVLRSLKFSPGDELLTTNHVYNAVRQAMKYIAHQSSAQYVEIDIPVPINSPADIEEPILRALTPRTKLIIIDHITSPTALIFPVEKILAACAERNVDVLIDGAHAPGMLPLNIEKLSPAYYAGNLHKWTCAPKGTAFLWVRPDKQQPIHPLVVSHFYEQGITKEFGWQGTRDISSWLAAPRALEYLSEIGWDQIMTHNHAMAVWANEFLCHAWNVQSISPMDGSMLGSMATLPLPAPLDQLPLEAIPKLQQRLHDEFHIELAIMTWSNKNYARPCFQIYNMPEEVHRLAAAIKQL